MREWFINDDLKISKKMKNEKLKSNENLSITEFEECNSSFKSLDIDWYIYKKKKYHK